MYNTITLCNNLYKISKRTKDPKEFGSALFAVSNSKINIYGGEISNNVNEVYIPKDINASILPQTMETYYIYDSKGVGIFMNCSILNMYDGKICNNEGINNSDIYTNKDAINNNNPKGINLYQRCLGIAIFSDLNSHIHLYKGEISNNKAINNSKPNLITPDNDKMTNMNVIQNCIFGSAIYTSISEFEMEKDFIIENNSSILNSTINIQKNCIIRDIFSCIRGGQIYYASTKVKIQGGIIQNSNNISKVKYLDEQGKNKDVNSKTLGGAIFFRNCKQFQINNLKINKCNAHRGGVFIF